MTPDQATTAIRDAAAQILAANPAPAVAVRLLRDVLGRSRGGAQLAAARRGYPPMVLTRATRIIAAA